VNYFTIKWMNTVYEDPSSYEKFREAISKNVWGPQVQARWRCVLCQSVYESTKDGSKPAHVPNYSAVANNLTPKLTESQTVEIISGIYPAKVQRTILSVGGMDISLCCEGAK